MQKDKNLIRAQLYKPFKKVDFFVPCQGNLVGVLIKFSVPLAKTFLTPLATIASASTIDGAIQNDNKIHERGDV